MVLLAERSPINVDKEVLNLSYVDELVSTTFQKIDEEHNFSQDVINSLIPKYFQ